MPAQGGGSARGRHPVRCRIMGLRCLVRTHALCGTGFDPALDVLDFPSASAADLESGRREVGARD